MRDYFGIPSLNILENWFHGISIIRNICAHHGRLWNRTFSKKNIILPNKC
ncbi:Abi family protein [Methanolapillus ohkumae]